MIDAVGEPDHSLCGGDKAPGLSHDDDERRLTQERGLARHVRPRDERNLRRAAAAEVNVVGDELPFLDQPFEHRVATAANAQDRLVHDQGANVVPARGRLRERRDRVHVRERRGCGEYLFTRAADLGADVAEETHLKLADALLRVQHERLVLLQLKRDEAFGGGERLLARVARGNEMQVRPRDLDEVAEDLVVADAQALDACPRALALLHLGEEGLAVFQQRAQAVQLLRIACADDARMLAAARQVVADGQAYAFKYAFTRGKRGERHAEARRVALKNCAHTRNGFEALSERKHFRGRREPCASATREPLQVVDVFERGGQLGTVSLVRDEPGDVFLAACNLGEVEERLSKPAAEHTPAHRRACLVERGEQRRRLARAVENFKAAHGLPVEHHERLGVVTCQPRQLLCDARLRLFEVRDDGGCGRGSERRAREAERCERARVEVLL